MDCGLLWRSDTACHALAPSFGLKIHEIHCPRLLEAKIAGDGACIFCCAALYTPVHACEAFCTLSRPVHSYTGAMNSNALTMRFSHRLERTAYRASVPMLCSFCLLCSRRVALQSLAKHEKEGSLQ